jgi:hypothetical protein
MANKKITDLTELTEAASDDYLEIVDTSANTSKKISHENLIAGHDHDSDYLGISAKAADSDKLDGLDSTDFVKKSALGVWQDWTPTITWAGGTTDPTSFTVLSARYVTVGNLVFCTLRGSLTRGSGDQSYLSLTAPVTISDMASGSAHHNINGNDFVLAPLYSESGKVTIFMDTMTKDGYIWAAWFYEK